MHKLCDMNYLYDGFKSSMKGSSWKQEGQIFERDLLHNLCKLQNEIEDETYHTSKGCSFFLNERGHMRYIHGNRIRDRVIRHVLCDEILNPALNPYLIYNNGASQTGKGISFSRNLFEKDLHNYYLEYGTNEGYIGFLDFSKFYDNIQHKEITKAILPKIDNKSGWLFCEALDNFRIDVSYMTDKEFANCYNTKFDSIEYYMTIPNELKTGDKFMCKSVDIGDQISQSIGVYFPTYVDNYVKIVRGQKRYGRYMDDMYIICRSKDELKDIMEGIRECAKEIGLFINPNKTKICKLSGNYQYLQLKYSLSSTGKVIKRINPKSITRERRKLKSYKHLLDIGQLKYEEIEQAYKSWMGSYKPLMSKQQFNNMRTLYYDLFGVKDVRWKK